MAAIIKIKRSSGTSAPSSLNAGELAFTYGTGTSANAGDRLFVGNGSSVDVIGGKYFTDIIDAKTSSNTASTLVERDASGNFSAGTITASLTGNVTGNVTGDVTGDLTGKQIQQHSGQPHVTFHLQVTQLLHLVVLTVLLMFLRHSHLLTQVLHQVLTVQQLKFL